MHAHEYPKRGYDYRILFRKIEESLFLRIVIKVQWNLKEIEMFIEVTMQKTRKHIPDSQLVLSSQKREELAYPQRWSCLSRYSYEYP